MARASATIAAAAAAAALLTLFRLVDAQVAAIEVATVHLGDRATRFFVAAHADEREAARAAGLAVEHELDLGHVADLTECVLNLGLGGLKREIADVESIAHFDCLSFRR